jgi:hypothetical protein
LVPGDNILDLEIKVEPIVVFLVKGTVTFVAVDIYLRR